MCRDASDVELAQQRVLQGNLVQASTGEISGQEVCTPLKTADEQRTFGVSPYRGDRAVPGRLGDGPLSD